MMSKLSDAPNMRAAFTQYWEGKGYDVVATKTSAPPQHLPQIDFSSCGAMHYGPVVHDGVPPPKNARIARIQRCVRPGSGLKIGHSPKHLTAFDMIDAFDFTATDRLESSLSDIVMFFADELGIGAENLVINVSSDDTDTLGQTIQCVATKLGIECRKLRPEQLVWNVKGAKHSGTRAEINWKKSPDDLWELWNISFIAGQFLDSGGSMERAMAAATRADSVFDTGELKIVKDRLQELQLQLTLSELHFLTDQVRSSTRLMIEGVLPGGNSGRRVFVRNLLNNVFGLLTRTGRLELATSIFPSELKPVLDQTQSNFTKQLEANRRAASPILRDILGANDKLPLPQCLEGLGKNPDTKWLTRNPEALLVVLQSEGAVIDPPMGSLAQKAQVLPGIPYYLIDALL